MTETMKRIVKARVAMLIDQPFFGVLALQLKIVESDRNATAWTDGTTIGFNPAFVATLSQDELIGVFCHECMHCACGHPWRRDAREMKKFNVACDHAINPVITEAGMKLPKGALLDAQYKGKNAEWIFDRLPDSQDDQSGDGCGEVFDAPGDQDGEGEAQTTEADWKELTKQAQLAAKAQGKLPASMQRELDAATKAIVDWRNLLRMYMQQVTNADYTWTRPNRRYVASNLYLPALRSIACGKIAIAVDTSGSIDAVTLAHFRGEMQSIIDELQPSSVEVVYCDASVNKIDVFERGEALTMSAVGGGGTSFVPVFDHYDQNVDDPPVVLVYFTDMYGDFPQSASMPVIWASTSSIDTAPFGDVVPIGS